MIILNYSPADERFRIGCTFSEAERHFLPLMDQNTANEYFTCKENRCEIVEYEKSAQAFKERYGLNVLPEVFFNVSRNLKECSVDRSLYQYPFSRSGENYFCECDIIEIESPSQLQRLVITHKGGEPFPCQPSKRKLFFDMDGTLVDFASGIGKVSPEILAQYDENQYDDIEGIFSLMDPMPGAVEAVKMLDGYYDCHILSTSPWNNPTACSDKVNWIKKYMGDVFYKKVTLTHHKEFLNDGESFLIDDRKAHGADTFGDKLITFDSENPVWAQIAERLVKMARDEGVGIGYNR